MATEGDTSYDSHKPVNVSLYHSYRAIQKLKQQNEKLKSEVQTIKTALEEALKRQKNARLESFRSQFAERKVHSADPEMQQLLGKIAEVKTQIETVRADLTSKHEDQALALESQVKMLKKRLGELEDEENTLKKIGKKQRRAIGLLQNDKDKVTPQVEALNKESAALGVKLKELKLKLAQRQVEWKSAHEQMVAMELKCRAAKQSLHQEPPEQSENDKELQEWSKKVAIMEKAISTEETKYTKRLEEFKTQTAEVQAKLAAIKQQEAEKDAEIAQLKATLAEVKGKTTRAQQRNTELLRQLNAAKPASPPTVPSPNKKKLAPVMVRARRQHADSSTRSHSVPVDSPDPIKAKGQ